jgi:hypothetical protein
MCDGNLLSKKMCDGNLMMTMFDVSDRFIVANRNSSMRSVHHSRLFCRANQKKREKGTSDPLILQFCTSRGKKKR